MEPKLVISLFFLAHFIADFILPAWKAGSKKPLPFLGYILHGITLLATGAILTLPFLSPRLLMVNLALTLIHLIIDLIHPRLKKSFPFFGLEFFLFEQCLHSLFILSSWPFIQGVELNWINIRLGYHLVSWYPVLGRITAKQLYLAVVVITGYIFGLNGGTIIVRQTLQKFDFIKKPQNNGGTGTTGLENIRQRWSIGAAVGILERLLIITLVLLKNYALIGLVLTGKSLVRFKEFTDQEFTEYYLIGSLTSILVALVVGILLISLFNLENASHFLSGIFGMGG
ncbi:MAG: DUF3307 domain-containing protein [Bacillota bacterium]